MFHYVFLRKTFWKVFWKMAQESRRAREGKYVRTAVLTLFSMSSNPPSNQPVAPSSPSPPLLRRGKKKHQPANAAALCR